MLSGINLDQANSEQAKLYSLEKANIDMAGTRYQERKSEQDTYLRTNFLINSNDACINFSFLYCLSQMDDDNAYIPLMGAEARSRKDLMDDRIKKLQDGNVLAENERFNVIAKFVEFEIKRIAAKHVLSPTTLDQKLHQKKNFRFIIALDALLRDKRFDRWFTASASSSLTSAREESDVSLQSSSRKEEISQTIKTGHDKFFQASNLEDYWTNFLSNLKAKKRRPAELMTQILLRDHQCLENWKEALNEACLDFYRPLSEDNKEYVRGELVKIQGGISGVTQGLTISPTSDSLEEEKQVDSPSTPQNSTWSTIYTPRKLTRKLSFDASVDAPISGALMSQQPSRLNNYLGLAAPLITTTSFASLDGRVDEETKTEAPIALEPPELVPYDTDKTVEKFQKAIEEYCKVKHLSDQRKKREQLKILESFVFSLSTDLSKDAPAATEKLQKLLKAKKLSMNAAYPYFYTMLQTVLATKGNSHSKEMKIAGGLLRFLTMTFINEHSNMLSQLCEGYSPAKKLAELDDSTYTVHDRVVLSDASSIQARQIVRGSSFVWSNFYRGRADETDGQILEQRRHFEAISVAALKGIIQNFTAGILLTIEERWLLVTAMTDYDEVTEWIDDNPSERARTISPFYNAIEFLALENDTSSKALRDKLCVSFFKYFKRVKTPEELTQRNLKEKADDRINILISREGEKRTDIQAAPNRFSQELAIEGELDKEQIIGIFQLCDALTLSEINSLKELLKKAFKAMDELFDKKVSQGGYNRNTYYLWPSKDALPPLYFEEFMQHLAPKRDMPPYTFAYFCQYQIDKGADLKEYEKDFIQAHIGRLYDRNDRRALAGLDQDLIESVAPMTEAAESTKKRAIDLIYSKLDRELRKLESRLPPSTVARSSLTLFSGAPLNKEDLKPYAHLTVVCVSPTLRSDSVGTRINNLIKHVNETHAPSFKIDWKK